MPAPTKFPRWATNDVQNPTSSEWNVVEPSEAKKDLGWDFKEYPPRQYFNWLGRITNAWIEWFDSLLDQAVNTDSDVNFNTVTTVADIVSGGGVQAICGPLEGPALDIGSGAFYVDNSGNITSVGSIDGTGNIELTDADFITNQGIEAATGSFTSSLSAYAANFGVGSVLQINTSGHFSRDIVQTNTGADAKSIKYRSFTDGEDFQDLISRCTFNGWSSWDVQIFQGTVRDGKVYLEFQLEGDADPGYLAANVLLPWDVKAIGPARSWSYSVILCDPSDNGDGFGHARIGVSATPNQLDFINGGWGVALNNWPGTGKKKVAGSICFIPKRET